MEKRNFNEDLRNRTMEFALAVIQLYSGLQKTDEIRIIGKQLIRSATSTAANFRAVSRARSERERFAKLSIVVEEIDESLFWIEILEKSQLVKKDKLLELQNEAKELVKIFSSYRKKLKNK